jgi:Sec-independent protein translocase protein TatA
LDSAFGYVSVYELAFIFLIVFLVVGPRRIIRGMRVIQEWIRNGFRRAGRTKTAKTGRNVMRGLGSMIAYYRDKSKDK